MWEHPLLGYIKQVKAIYKYNNKPIQDWNFKHWLDWLSENKPNGSVKDLLEIFEPLDITIDGKCALFHYKGSIDLSDMGYSEADFFGLYDGLYRECRSCVFDVEKEELLACSLSKFKNYNESDDEWSEKNIRQKYATAKYIWITNKMDGSYQQFRYLEDEDRIFGSGSQAINPKESWRLTRGFSFLTDSQKKLIKDYPDYTFIFEFICVDNPIVVHYTKEQEGMYLITARDCTTGLEMDFNALRDIAKRYDCPVVDFYDSENLDSLLAQVDNFASDEKEGWVIRMQDEDGNDFRVKLKVTDYVLMHKAISKLVSPNAVVQAIAEDKYDDFYSKVPDGFKDIVKGFYLETVGYISSRINLGELWYSKMFDEITKDRWDENYSDSAKRKIKNIWITENVPKCIQSDVRNIVDKRETKYLYRRGFPYRHSEILKMLKDYERAYNKLQQKYIKKEE